MLPHQKNGPPWGGGPGNELSLLSGDDKVPQKPEILQAKPLSKSEERERWLFQIANAFCRLHRDEAPRDALFAFVWENRRLVRTHFAAGTRRDDVLCELIDLFAEVRLSRSEAADARQGDSP